MNFFTGLVLVALIASALANCGCLKCSKHLTVVSPSSSPCKIIYRENPSAKCGCGCQNKFSYSVEAPVPAPVCPYVGKQYGYQVQVPAKQCAYEAPLCSYAYSVEAPVVPAPTPYIPLTGLKTLTDRVVMDAPCQKCPEDLPVPAAPLCAPAAPLAQFYPAPTNTASYYSAPAPLGSYYQAPVPQQANICYQGAQPSYSFAPQMPLPLQLSGATPCQPKGPIFETISCPCDCYNRA